MDDQNLSHDDVFPISEVDRHVLTLIRNGDRKTWNDFVVLYHRRLLSFALRQVDQEPTAEDVVQETFVSFLKSLDRFRQDCDIETFLFQILRRRIVDYYRSKGKTVRMHTCGSIEEWSDEESSRLVGMTAAIDPSHGMQQLEDQTEYARILSRAICVVCGRLRTKKKFRDLKIAEGTLYASLPNSTMAEMLQCKSNEVAVVKHRLITRLTEAVQELGSAEIDGTTTLAEELLATVWKRVRPSCPKRTTLGKFLLKLLPDDWHSYVDFHAEQLRCQYCLANIDELSAVPIDEENAASTRVFHSTIGFLRGSSR